MDISYVDKRDNLPADILKKLETANIFFTEAYCNIIKSQRGTVLYLYSEDYIMPIAIKKRYIFKWAAIVSEYHLLNDNRSQSTKDFLDGCMECLNKKIGVHWVSPAPVTAFFDDYPTKSQRIPFGNYVLDLTLREDELFTKMNTKCRCAIKYAIKNDVIVKMGGLEYYDDFVKVANETWERSGSKVTDLKKEFQELEIMGDRGKAFFAFKDDVVQSAMIVYFSEKFCYPIYGGSKTDQVRGATNLLYWEVIKYMQHEGVKEFTFVGCRINEDKDSKYHDIQRFKKLFGGELKQGYLFKVNFNQLMHLLFHLLTGLKTRNFKSSHPVDQEIHKWKELNEEN